MFVYPRIMSRCKTISDDQLIDRILPALMAHGPSSLSFVNASQASGLSAATLVQRFGSRAGMVEAVLQRVWDQLDAKTAEADADCPSDPAGAVELLLRLTSSETADYDFTDGLLLLREDIQNPVLRARGAEWGSRLAGVLGRRLSNDAGRATELGWQMASLWQGTLVWWAFQRDEALEVKVRKALEDWYRGLGIIP